MAAAKRPQKKLHNTVDEACHTHTMIHLRECAINSDAPSDYEYCVEIFCKTHSASWTTICKALEDADRIARNFPLVYGGLCMRKDGLRVSDKCLLTQIQKVDRL